MISFTYYICNRDRKWTEVTRVWGWGVIIYWVESILWDDEKALKLERDGGYCKCTMCH